MVFYLFALVWKYDIYMFLLYDMYLLDSLNLIEFTNIYELFLVNY